MPTYEYTCQKCSKTFEHVQPISSERLTVCPREICPRKTWGKGTLVRGLGGGSGLIFKGSGFYITDYRSDSYKTAASSESSPASQAKPSSTPASPPPPSSSTPGKPSP